MEIVSALDRDLKLDFIEVQGAFSKYFDLNVKMLGPLGTNMTFINQDYRNLYHDEKFHAVYDLVVSNPPYFEVGKKYL